MIVALPPSFLPLRLGVILNGVRQVLAVRAGRDRDAAAKLLLLWNRLSRVLARVSAIAARYHAGTLKAPAERRPRPLCQPPPPDPLPRHPAWLVQWSPECAAYGENLRWLLAEPEVAAMIQAAPQLRRLLRPLWRMLQPGPPPPVLQSVPESLARPARRPQNWEDAPSSPAAAPPETAVPADGPAPERL